MNEQRISDTILMAEVEKFPDDVYRKQLSEWLLTEYPFLRWRDELTEGESSKLQRLGKNLKNAFQLRVGLFVNGELKGWTFGWQDASDSFYMGASAISPELRRQGLYSRLISYVLTRTKELGFQTISSNHILTNNSVIIAKLKMGFTIKGIEVDAVHGTLLKLNYHHNALMRSAAKFRAGAVNDQRVLKNLQSIT